MKSQIKLCLLFSLLVLLISCGNDNSTGPDPDPDPVPDPNPAPNVVSKEIGPDGGEITSADGLLTLTFPAGALDSEETITIAPLDADNLGSEFDDIEIEQAYDLGPDGLAFDIPITATFLTEQNPIAGSDSVEFVTEFLLTSDNSQAVELDSLQTIVEFDEGTVTVQGQLSHFSPLVESLVQARTNATGRFSLSGFPDEVIASPDIFSALLLAEVDQEVDGEEPFMVTKVLIEQSRRFPLFAVSPGEGVTEFPPKDILIAELDYRCTRVGLGKLFIRGSFIDEITRQSEKDPNAALKFAVAKSVNCVKQMPETVNLQIAPDGNGSGSVLSVPAGIDCPDDCEEEYNEGTMVTLTATPDQGSEFVTWSGDFDSSNNAADSLTIQLTMDQARLVTATFELEQVNSGFLQLGLFTLPVLTNPETIVTLGGPEQAFANFPNGSVPALMQGAEGFIVIDLINGEVLLDFAGLPNNGSLGERIPLGALAVSRPGPGPNTVSLIASYGQDNNSTEFGFNLFPYDIQDQSFSTVTSPFPSTIDAFQIGGNVISDEIVIVREGNFGITFNRYNEISNQYLFDPSNEARISARYGFEQPVTAYGEFVEGNLLVVNAIGDLYFDPRNKLIPSVLIGNVGEKIIKIRCKIPICVTTDESGDALGIIRWDGLNQPTIVNRLQVGDGPVDPDLYTLPNGNTLIGVGGFNDNTISQLEVDPVGTFISGQIYNAPDGLVNPGHFHFINNPDDPTNPFVSITGFGSDNYYIQDTIEIGKLTLNAGVRPIE